MEDYKEKRTSHPIKDELDGITLKQWEDAVKYLDSFKPLSDENFKEFIMFGTIGEINPNEIKDLWKNANTVD